MSRKFVSDSFLAFTLPASVVHWLSSQTELNRNSAQQPFCCVTLYKECHNRTTAVYFPKARYYVPCKTPNLLVASIASEVSRCHFVTNDC